MKKDNENKFFAPFLPGGTAFSAVEWLREDIENPADSEDIHYHGETECNILREAVTDQRICFGWSLGYGTISDEEAEKATYWNHDWDMLFEEIDSNIKECSDNNQRESYLFAIMKPVAKFMVEAKDFISEDIESTEEAEGNGLINSVEDAFVWYLNMQEEFVNRLDALLLTYRIDLLRLQRMSDLYLTNGHDYSWLEEYFGSMTLVQKFIDELPTMPFAQAEIADFASLFVVGSKTDVAEDILGKIASLKSGRIAHEMSCRQKAGTLKNYTGIQKDVHDWLDNHSDKLQCKLSQQSSFNNSWK